MKLGWRDSVRTFLQNSRRGIEDIVVSMIPQGIRVTAGMITYVLLARGLGPAGLGQYALSLSVAEVTGQLAEFGLGQTGARFAARAVSLGDREGQMAILRWAFRIRMSLVLVTSAVVFLVAPTFVRFLWHDERLIPLVRVALPTAFFLSLASVPITYFQSEKRFGRSAIVSGGQALVSLIGVVVLAWLGLWSVRTALIVMVLSTAVGAIQFMMRIPKEAWWPGGNAVHEQRRQPFWRSPALRDSDNADDRHKPMEFAAFLFLSSLIVLVSGKIDLWLIGTYLDVAQVGVYSAAGRLTLPLVIVLGAFNTVLLPRAASATTLVATRALAARTFKISLMLAAMGAVYSILVPIVIPHLFGRVYQSSILIAQLLCLGNCVAILVCPVGLIGYNLGLVRFYWITNLIQLGATVATLVILLPKVGALAGAIAFLANITVGGILNTSLVWARLRATR